MVEAFLLAGSDGPSELTEKEKVKNKALIEINGAPLITYIIDALDKCLEISRTVVVGPAAELQSICRGRDVPVLQEKGSIAQNIIAGTKALTADSYILLVTADVPLLSPEAIKDFLEKCRPFAEADFFYPIIPKTISEEKFPGMKRTYAPLKDGVFTGGNIMLFNAAKVEECMPKVEKFIAARKSPLKLLMLLGIGFLFRFTTGRLALSDIEKSFSRILGARSKAIISSYPEIGTDIDKVSDLEHIRRLMRKKTNFSCF